MSEEIRSLKKFLQGKLAARLRDMMTAAEQRLAQARHYVEDMHAGNGSIGWEIGNDERWFINLRQGAISVTAQPESDPFLTVAMSASAWAQFAGGALPTGVFEGGSARPFGRNRIERLRAIKGALGVVLTGLPDSGTFTITLHFAGQRPHEPQATVQMTADVAAKIGRGELNPQAAFMQGQMKLLGDMSFAMQLGMALLL